jgi:hypothetical protein
VRAQEVANPGRRPFAELVFAGEIRLGHDDQVDAELPGTLLGIVCHRRFAR